MSDEKEQKQSCMKQKTDTDWRTEYVIIEKAFFYILASVSVYGF